MMNNLVLHVEGFFSVIIVFGILLVGCLVVGGYCGHLIYLLGERIKKFLVWVFKKENKL